MAGMRILQNYKADKAFWVVLITLQSFPAHVVLLLCLSRSAVKVGSWPNLTLSSPELLSAQAHQDIPMSPCLGILLWLDSQPDSRTSGHMCFCLPWSKNEGWFDLTTVITGEAWDFKTSTSSTPSHTASRHKQLSLLAPPHHITNNIFCECSSENIQ